MHPALSGVALCALCGGTLIDHALLHDCAVHGEAVRGRLGGVRWGGCGDEGFQDSVLGVVRGRRWREMRGLTMIVEFQELTAVCSYSVTFLRASSQACEC